MVRQGTTTSHRPPKHFDPISAERERPRDHGDLNKTLVHTPSSLSSSRRRRRRRRLVTVPCFHG